MILAAEHTTSAESASCSVAHTISNVSFLAINTRQEKSILPQMLLLDI